MIDYKVLVMGKQYETKRDKKEKEKQTKKGSKLKWTLF